MIRRLVVHGSFLANYDLPSWTGTCLRGVFGVSLQRVLCNKPKRSCQVCEKKPICLYHYLFETAPYVKSDASIARKAVGITKPFTWSPLSCKNGGFTFTLNLFGERAKRAEAYIVASLLEMGRLGLGRDKRLGERRRFNMELVTSSNDITGEEVEVYRKDAGYVTYLGGAEKADVTNGQITDLVRKLISRKPAIIEVFFKTPTMLVYLGKPVLNVELHHMVRNLTRKYSLMAHYHGIGEPLTSELAKDLIKVSEEHFKVERVDLRRLTLPRYSMRRLRWERYGPFVRGLVRYRVKPEFWRLEEAEKVLWLLIFGRYSHVGKLTTFGCGEYGLRAYGRIL